MSQRIIRVVNPTKRVVNVVDQSRAVSIVQSTVRVIRAVERGEQGPPGEASEAIYFDYGDATPAILDTPLSDLVVKSVWLTVVIPFNGTGAKVSIGTQAEPELLMAEDESDLSVTSTYETSPLATVNEGTEIKAFITPGSGASAGRCMVLFEYAEA
jgi:hypothetical protein